MRVVILLTPVLLLTGCAQKESQCSATRSVPPAKADEPRDEPIPPPDRWAGKFNTNVTLRRWDEFTGTFLSATRLAALKQNGTDQNGADQVRWLVNSTGTESDYATPKSEIIDAEGTVWIVYRMERSTTLYTVCYVKKREPSWPWSRPSTVSASSMIRR